MGYDSRFPHMHRVHDAPGVDASHRAMLVETAARVCNRVPGLRCSYDAHTASLFFHYPTLDKVTGVWDYGPNSGPMRLPAFTGDRPARYESHDIDAAVAFINYGRIDRTVKDRIERNRKADEQHKHEADTDRLLDERRPTALDYADFRDRKRRGTSKVIA